MKRIVILFLLLPYAARGAAPSTSCPTGYVAIDDAGVTISDSCPTGTVDIGAVESCLVSSPAGDCWMYAPANTTYDDETGYYHFSAACPLE